MSLVAMGFLGGVAALAWLGQIPFWLAGMYWVASPLTFLLYWVDKVKARNNQWRIAEKTLHALEFLCGWPGGLLAQHWLRHKNQKTAYQFVFWLVVAVNLGVVGLWWWSGFPSGEALFRELRRVLRA